MSRSCSSNNIGTPQTGCKQQPIPQAKTNSVAAQIAKAMGVQSCDMSSVSASMRGKVQAFLASASVEATYHSSNAIGCEQIVIQAEQMNRSIQQVACTLNQYATCKSSRTIAGNTMSFGDIKIKNCSNVMFSQSIQVDDTQIDISSGQARQEITNKVKSELKSVIDNSMKSKQGVGAPTASQKAIYEKIINEIDQSFQDSVSNTAMTNIKEFNASNGMYFGNVEIDCAESGGKYIFTQSISITRLAKDIMTNAIDQALSSVNDQIIDLQTTSNQEGEVKGADDLSKWNSQFDMILYIIIGVAVFILLIFIIKSLKTTPDGKIEVDNETLKSLSNSILNNQQKQSSQSFGFGSAKTTIVAWMLFIIFFIIIFVIYFYLKQKYKPPPIRCRKVGTPQQQCTWDGIKWEHDTKVYEGTGGDSRNNKKKGSSKKTVVIIVGVSIVVILFMIIAMVLMSGDE